MRTIALISTTAVVVAVAFSPSNETIVGFTPAFMPAFFAAVFLIELMTAYLLWQQFEAQGEIRLLGLSLTYLFTALLVIPTALTHPFVLNTTSILGGTPSTPVWFWVTWHLVFPLGLAASLAPWPERAVRYVRNHHVRVRQRAIGALVLGVVVLSYLFTQGLTTVPVLGGVLDYPRMAGTLGPWVVLFSVLSLVAVIIRSHPSHPLERWIVVAAAAITSDSLLTVAAGARLTVGWYAGRALALAATGVVLVGLTREVGRMYRETLISNQELREENERDALTGVFSRRAILERADALMHGPGDVAMAVVDLDHFKAVNDSYGHQVGDEVLVWIAGRMSTCLRGGDAVGRLGGRSSSSCSPGPTLRWPSRPGSASGRLWPTAQSPRAQVTSASPPASGSPPGSPAARPLRASWGARTRLSTPRRRPGGTRSKHQPTARYRPNSEPGVPEPPLRWFPCGWPRSRHLKGVLRA